MSKRPPALVDQRLVKALAHPTRVHILNILNERIASPNQLSKELDEELSGVSYHVKVLKELGCLELVDTKPRRGAMEHFYRATQRQFFNVHEWEEVEPEGQRAITATILQMISEDTSRALEQGTFDELPDNHLTRTPMTVDMEGWTEVVSILKEALDELFAVQTKSSERMAQSGEESMPVKVVMMQFKSPEPSAEGEKGD